MNYGPLIFLAAFFALASSWFGLVLTPQIQVGHMQQTNTVPDNAAYPLARPGLAQQGLAVYRANGCAYCHSQQVRQTGMLTDVVLMTPGSDEAAIVQAIRKVNPNLTEAEAKELLGKLPQVIKQDVSKEEADRAKKILSVGKAKNTPWYTPVGPDIARGWGKRRSVAEDFLYDYPVMPGSQRIGPDLANVGLRTDANTLLLHLYAPRALAPGSPMPAYRYLFEKRKIERNRSSDALNLPDAVAPAEGYEIVPKTEAKALVAYLLSLRANEPLFSAPFSVSSAPAAAAGTNAPAGGTTNSAPANPPAK